MIKYVTYMSECVVVSRDDGSEIVFEIVISTDKPARLCSKSGINCNHKETRTYFSLDIMIGNKVTQVCRVDKFLNII